MRHGYKGFTLVELMVTIAVLAILVTVGIPSFVSVLNNNRADTEVSDLVRGLNYARLEAINRGVSVQVRPATANTWTGQLNIGAVTSGSGATAVLSNPLLRVVPAMSSSANLDAPSTAYIEFNNMGALNFPASALNVTYTRGSITRSVGVCVNGRIVASGTC